MKPVHRAHLILHNLEKRHGKAKARLILRRRIKETIDRLKALKLAQAQQIVDPETFVNYF